MLGAAPARTWVPVAVDVRGALHGVAEARRHALRRPPPLQGLGRRRVQARGSAVENVHDPFSVFTPVGGGDGDV